MGKLIEFTQLMKLENLKKMKINLIIKIRKAIKKKSKKKNKKKSKMKRKKKKIWEKNQ